VTLWPGTTKQPRSEDPPQNVAAADLVLPAGAVAELDTIAG
jgi:hypothetical protein